MVSHNSLSVLSAAGVTEGNNGEIEGAGQGFRHNVASGSSNQKLVSHCPGNGLLIAA
jgi:hypothetical protein